MAKNKCQWLQQDLERSKISEQTKMDTRSALDHEALVLRSLWKLAGLKDQLFGLHNYPREAVRYLAFWLSGAMVWVPFCRCLITISRHTFQQEHLHAQTPKRMLKSDLDSHAEFCPTLFLFLNKLSNELAGSTIPSGLSPTFKKDAI